MNDRPLQEKTHPGRPKPAFFNGLVGIGDDALGLVAEFELGVAEEGVVGGGDEPSCHFQDGVGDRALMRAASC